jgi:hypothetical protein
MTTVRRHQPAAVAWAVVVLANHDPPPHFRSLRHSDLSHNDIHLLQFLRSEVISTLSSAVHHATYGASGGVIGLPAEQPVPSQSTHLTHWVRKIQDQRRCRPVSGVSMRPAVAGSLAAYRAATRHPSTDTGLRSAAVSEGSYQCTLGRAAANPSAARFPHRS